jgi:hypothetical protein
MGGLAVASSDASEPARTGKRLAAHLKDRLRPLASALPQLSGLPSWARAMGVLKHHGFSPATVFDIGVAYGTFPLYQAVEESEFVRDEKRTNRRRRILESIMLRDGH